MPASFTPQPCAPQASRTRLLPKHGLSSSFQHHEPTPLLSLPNDPKRKDPVPYLRRLSCQQFFTFFSASLALPLNENCSAQVQHRTALCKKETTLGRPCATGRCSRGYRRRSGTARDAHGVLSRRSLIGRPDPSRRRHCADLRQASTLPLASRLRNEHEYTAACLCVKGKHRRLV